MNEKNATTIGIFLVIAGLAVFTFWPLVVIWALNTLFPVLRIPYSWETWGAVLVMFTLFNPMVKHIKK